MHHEWILYCDEAGNAGPNYMDQEQPYHVSAGWLVRPDGHDRFERAIGKAAMRTKAGELKGANLLRRSSGVNAIVQLFKALAASGACLPFFIIADRRFCLAGKAVDTFLDPVTNPAAHWLPTGALARRQEIWEIIASLPDEPLYTFAAAYRNPNTHAFRTALRAIIDALRAEKAPRQLIMTFEGAETYVDRITEYETHGSEVASHGVETALNMPVFFHLVKGADRFMDAVHPEERIVIIHDEIRGFAPVLERTVRSLTVPSGVSAEFVGTEGEMVRLGVTQVARFEIASSTNVLGLQAADLLASSVARLARDAKTGSPWSSEFQELARLTLPALLTGDDDVPPTFAGMLANRDDIGTLLAHFLTDARPLT